MSCILALDLSTPRGHLVVMDDRELLYLMAFTSERSHNSMLYGPLDEALKAAGDDLSMIVVGTGPGSYTGVRISIAAAQGIAISRNVPVIGIPSIAALFKECAVIGDARRGKFYAAHTCEGRLVGGIELFDEAGLRGWLELHAHLHVCSTDNVAPLGLPGVELRKPSASLLAAFAMNGAGSEADALEPLYVQDAFITKAKTPTMGQAATASSS